MAPLPDSARAVVLSDALAHISTVDEDGSPHVTIAWVGLDGDDVVMATLHDQRKLRNLRRNPSVAISLETANSNPIGLREYLVLYGRGEVTEGGAPQLLQQLAYTYLGADVKFPPMDDPPPGYVTRISVERVGGVGPWRG